MGFIWYQISSFLLNIFSIEMAWQFLILSCMWMAWNSISDFLKTSFWYVYKKVRKKSKMNPSIFGKCVRVKHVKSFGIFHQYIFFKEGTKQMFSFLQDFYFVVPYFEMVDFVFCWLICWIYFSMNLIKTDFFFLKSNNS